MFYVFLISTEEAHLQYCLVVTWLVPRQTAAVSAHVLCTPYNHAPIYIVTSLEAIKVGCILCLAVTCHLHFLGRNDRDLLRANVVTRGVERIPKYESV